MTEYARTSEGLAAALEAAGDESRLWFDGDVIRVLPEKEVEVPTKVTHRQFKQGLTRLNLRDDIEGWREGLDLTKPNDQDAADWYDKSTDFERSNPVLIEMVEYFGLSSSQIDEAFVMMAGL